MSIYKENDLFYISTGGTYRRVLSPRFDHYTSADMYEKAGLKGYAPMTAKEIDTEEQQDAILNDPNYIIEEKFDGTRALMYFLSPNPLRQGNMSRAEYLFRFSLLKGSVMENGKDRIYDVFVTSKSRADKIDFLKKEYGWGGTPVTYPDNTTGDIMFSPKGYEIKYDNTTKMFSWSDVADAISEMIGLMQYYPQEGYARCFSRRISEKTKWYCENTDSLPQLRSLNVPELKGTIIDGEMFIPNRPFKDVSSTLNCKWDKAIDRQLDLGYVVFHAFDILFYKGIDLRKMPLSRRKVYLQLVIDKLNSPYVKSVTYQKCGGKIDTTPYHESHGTPYTICRSLEESRKLKSYPNLHQEYAEDTGVTSLSPRAFYEYIVATGGEGVMVKPLDGKYHHKRGREYQKIKKFLTREVVIMGFTDPTDEYKGKFPTIDKWNYWETNEGDLVDLSEYTPEERKQFEKAWYPYECRPVSKFYCYNWVGTIRFGVVITPEEVSKLPKSKKFNVEEMILEGDDVLVLEVGECSGFDEETRELFSRDPDHWIGSVIEVKANEIFRDTGKLRHPRFMRVRKDKSPIECTYKDHVAN